MKKPSLQALFQVTIVVIDTGGILYTLSGKYLYEFLLVLLGYTSLREDDS
jgi:hypothetical protein